MGDERRQYHFHGNVFGAEARREELNGTEYVVAPVVALREMVLEYGNRRELVPAAELEPTVERQLWEGRPFTVDHPTKGGRWLGAGTVEARRKFGIGTIQNMRIGSRGEMKGEVWIDPDRAAEVDGGEAILEAVDNGEQVEVSTGYWAAFDPSPGIHNATGEAYDGVQRDFDPDHLAGLPNAVGRCSIEDGCGLMRLNARSTARTPDFSGTSSGEVPDGWPPTFSDYVDAFFEGDEPPETVEDAPQSLKDRIAATSLLGDASADAFRDLRLFPVVDTSGNLQEGALRAVISGRGAQASISESALESARGIARNLLEEEFDADLEENARENVRVREAIRTLSPGRVKQAVLNALGVGDPEPRADQEATLDSLRDALDDAVSDAFGGPNTFVFVEDVLLESERVVWSVRDEGEGKDTFWAPFSFDAEDGEVEVDFAEREEVRQVTTFEPVENAAGSTGNETEDPPMKLNDAQRTAIISALVACDACSYENEEALEPLADEDLIAIARNRELEIEDVALEEVAGGEEASDPGGSDPAAAAEGGSDPADGGEGSSEEEEGEEGVTLSREQYEALQNLLEESEETRAERERQRKELAGKLVRRDNCAFTREELEEKPLDELEKIDQMTSGRSFAHRGGPRGNADGDGEQEGYHDTVAREGIFQVYGNRAKRAQKKEQDGNGEG